MEFMTVCILILMLFFGIVGVFNVMLAIGITFVVKHVKPVVKARSLFARLFIAGLLTIWLTPVYMGVVCLIVYRAMNPES